MDTDIQDASVSHPQDGGRLGCKARETRAGSARRGNAPLLREIKALLNKQAYGARERRLGGEKDVRPFARFLPKPQQGFL